MKIRYALISISAFVLIISCSKKEPVPHTPQEKAEAAAKAYFSAHHMEVQKKSAAFKTIDTIKTAMSEDSMTLYKQKADDYLNTAEMLISTDFKTSGMYSDSSVYWSQKLLNYIHSFKPVQSGWKLDYQFPGDGNYLYSGYVLLDTAFQIISVKENK